MVLFQQFFDHITVLELFALTSDEHFHIGVAVESGYLLAPATIDLTILKSDYEFVIGLECLKGLRVRDVMILGLINVASTPWAFRSSQAFSPSW